MERAIHGALRRVQRSHASRTTFAKITSKRNLSSQVAASSETPPVRDPSKIYEDVYGRKLRFQDNGKRMPFFYDPVTFDSYEVLLTTTEKPKYATSWEDPNFPGWVQYMDSTGKRPFYMDRANPISQVTWAPPGEPDRDIFAEEYERSKQPLKKVPDDVLGAPLMRRFAAVGVDVGVSMCAGMGFGLLVYLDLGKPFEAASGMGFSTMIFFLLRDSVFERGTRSIGKRLAKLEIVRSDGQLPTRWNTALRQIYLPIYTGATLLMPYIVLLPIAELGFMLFTQRSYRIGDIIGQTRVIMEQHDRDARFKEKCQRDDEDDAKD